MALTKIDLIEKLVKKFKLSKRDSQEIVELFFEELSEAIVTKGEVKLSGFGNFATRDKKSRPGRNPKTGEPVEIAARRVVTFHAGQKLKARVEEYSAVSHKQ